MDHDIKEEIILYDDPMKLGKIDKEKYMQLQIQNQKLNEQLKELNSKLNAVLTSMKIRSSSQPKDAESTEALRAELDLAHKKLSGYQKEIKLIKLRGSPIANLDRINNLENSIIERDRTIGLQQSEMKILQKMIRDLEKNNEKLYSADGNDMKNKLKVILDENRFLKEKIKQRRPMNNDSSSIETNTMASPFVIKSRVGDAGKKDSIVNDEKTERPSQESENKSLLPSFKRKNLPLSPAGRTSANLNKSFHLPKRQVTGGNSVEPIVQADEKKEREKCERLMASIKILKQNKAVSDKKFQQQIEALQSEVRELRLQLDERNITLKRKENEVSELKLKLKEERRKKNEAVSDSNSFHLHTGEDYSIDRGASPSDISYDTKGISAGDKAFKFTDRSLLMNDYFTKIVKMNIWSDSSGIKGVQAIYQKQNMDIVVGYEHLLMEKEKLTTQTFEITSKGDFLKSIGGLITISGEIVSLVLASVTGRVERYGYESSSALQFELDIGETYLPICLFSELKLINETESALCVIGCEMRRIVSTKQKTLSAERSKLSTHN